MKRILIGVVLVILLGVAGYVGMVLGQVAEDPPLVASPTAEGLGISPSASTMLVLPTVGQVTIEVEATRTPEPTFQAAIDQMMSGDIPTPIAGCSEQVIDLSGGNTYTLRLSNDASVWYSISTDNPVINSIGPMISSPVTIGGVYLKDGYPMPSYAIREPSIQQGIDYVLQAGDYLLTCQSTLIDLGVDCASDYKVYTCPPLRN